MIHGLDIPLDKPRVFERAVAEARPITDSAGIELLTMATNFRTAVPADWEDAFATGLAACLSLFQAGFSAGIINSCYAHHSLQFPCGSTPIIDPMLSGGGFTIVHFGASRDRMQKIQEISQWPEAMEHLRICWKWVRESEADDPEMAGNCGRCQKCVSNVLMFRTLDLDPPATLDRPVSNRQIVMLRARGRQLEALRHLAHVARDRHPTASWTLALALSVWQNRLSRVVRGIRHRLSTRLTGRRRAASRVRSSKLQAAE